MGSKIRIGDNNNMEKTNIVGGDVYNTERKSNGFWLWVLKHAETIVTAIISGAVSAAVSWFITYLCLK